VPQVARPDLRGPLPEPLERGDHTPADVEHGAQDRQDGQSAEQGRQQRLPPDGALRAVTGLPLALPGLLLQAGHDLPGIVHLGPALAEHERIGARLARATGRYLLLEKVEYDLVLRLELVQGPRVEHLRARRVDLAGLLELPPEVPAALLVGLEETLLTV
jgi:hypothetical protein